MTALNSRRSTIPFFLMLFASVFVVMTFHLGILSYLASWILRSLVWLGFFQVCDFTSIVRSCCIPFYCHWRYVFLGITRVLRLITILATSSFPVKLTDISKTPGVLLYIFWLPVLGQLCRPFTTLAGRSLYRQPACAQRLAFSIDSHDLAVRTLICLVYTAVPFDQRVRSSRSMA